MLLLSINDEPSNFQEAKNSKQWTNACEVEIDSINKNNTWSLVDKPAGVKIIGLKWGFKIKRNADGTIKNSKLVLSQKDMCKSRELISLGFLLQWLG